MAYAVARKERKLLPLAWITVVSLVLFWVLPDGRLWNARVLPFFYVSLAPVGRLRRRLAGAAVHGDDVRPLPPARRTARRVYVPVVAVVIGAVLVITSTTAGGWIKWNYSGYEGKPDWAQYKEINDFLDTLEPRARVMIEHGEKLDEFGTPRAFEIIPYWTERGHHGRHPDGGLLHGRLPLHQPGGALRAAEQRHHRGRLSRAATWPGGSPTCSS